MDIAHIKNSRLTSSPKKKKEWKENNKDKCENSYSYIQINDNTHIERQ